MVAADDVKKENCKRGQHLKTIRSSKPLPLEKNFNASAIIKTPSSNSLHKVVESSQRFLSSSSYDSVGMIRMYHSSSKRNESVNPNPQHHDEKYTDSPQQEKEQKQYSKKEKFQNAAKRGSNLAKKGASSATELVRKYGWTFIGTYGSIYLFTLGSLFVGVDSGLIDPTILTDIQFPWTAAPSEGLENAATVDDTCTDKKDGRTAVQLLASYLETFEFTKPYARVVEENVHLSNLAIAWVATKITEPIRLAMTVAILPRVSKFLQPSQTKSKVDED